jgi:hypothetical protein
VAVHTRVPGRVLMAGSSERGTAGRYLRTDAGSEVLEAAGREFLVELAAGERRELPACEIRTAMT